MKKIFFLLLIVLTVSCSKEEDNTIYKTKEVRINLSNNLSYFYYLGNFEETEVPEITDQAQHFEHSDLLRNEETGGVSYRYKPLSEFVGEDYVEVLSEKIIDAENDKKQITTLKLTFIVL